MISHVVFADLEFPKFFRGAAGGEKPPPPFIRPYEQVFVEASHFMWAFSHSAFVLGGAAKVGVMKLTANPSATSTVRSFFMEASPRRVALPSR